MILKGTKEDSKLLRWLQAAATKDESRPVLLGVMGCDGYAVACDGFRLHAAKTELIPEDKNLHGKVKAGNFEVDMFEIGGTYPSWQQILPTGPVELAIGVDPKLLIEALKGMENPVTLRFYSPTSPMEVLGKDRYALVMPLRDSRDDSPWRPGKPQTAKMRIRGKLEVAERALRTALDNVIDAQKPTAGGNEEEA